MTTQTQYLDTIDSIIKEKVDQFKNESVSITHRNTLPNTGIYRQNCWFKVPDVICVFVDIRGSTQLSAVSHDNSTANLRELAELEPELEKLEKQMMQYLKELNIK